MVLHHTTDYSRSSKVCRPSNLTPNNKHRGERPPCFSSLARSFSPARTRTHKTRKGCQKKAKKSLQGNDRREEERENQPPASRPKPNQPSPITSKHQCTKTSALSSTYVDRSAIGCRQNLRVVGHKPPLRKKTP